MDKKGFGILEILIAVAIIAGSLWALASVFLLSGAAIELSRERLQASFLLEEGIEVIRHLRDAGWDTNIGALTPGTDYYFGFNPATGGWSIGALPEPAIESIFSRKFRLERVSRDINSNVESVYNPANEDQETRKVVLTVTWMFKQNQQASTLEAYLTDMFNN